MGDPLAAFGIRIRVVDKMPAGIEFALVPDPLPIDIDVDEASKPSKQGVAYLGVW